MQFNNRKRFRIYNMLPSMIIELGKFWLQFKNVFLTFWRRQGKRFCYRLIKVITCIYGMCSSSEMPAPSSWPNLEKMAQRFIVETKQIHIPGYEDAFNPSIIDYSGGKLMCFRTREPSTHSTNRIGFVWLDNLFNPMSPVQIVDMTCDYTHVASWVQDPRLIEISGEIYMLYSNLVGFDDIQRRMIVSRLQIIDGIVHIEPGEPLVSFRNQNPLRQEKNWVPFDCDGELLLEYSLSPHVVLKPQYNGICDCLAVTPNNIQWNWGELRGGTCAVKIGEEYLAFFHSSKEMKTEHSQGQKISHYFIGAYTFQATSPFSITRISPEPIIAPNFYTAPDYPTWKPLRVVFPGGYITDAKHIWIVYGKQDFETWVVKIDKQLLLESLVPVTSFQEFEIAVQ